MSLYKQAGSDRWWISVYDVNGRRRRFSSGTDDRDRAEAVEASIRAAMRGSMERERLFASIDALMGWESAGAGVPIAELWNTYLATKPRAGADSLARRRRLCDKLTAWIRMRFPTVKALHEITPQMALGFCDWMADEMGGVGKTQNGRVGNLKTVFQAIVIRANLQSNPFEFVERADESDSRHGRAWTPEEERRLKAAEERAGNRWPEVTLVMRYTGLRFKDVALLTAAMVEGDVLNLEPHKTRRHQIGVLIPLHPKVKKAFHAFGRSAGAEGFRLEALGNDGGYVFPQQAAVYYDGFQKPTGYNEIIAAAGIEPDGAMLSIHCWRHTWTTRMLDAGVDPEIVKELGGWTERKTQMIYNHSISQYAAAIRAME
jgi:integrase